jgi:hypothetical protein
MFSWRVTSLDMTKLKVEITPVQSAVEDLDSIPFVCVSVVKRFLIALSTPSINLPDDGVWR